MSEVTLRDGYYLLNDQQSARTITVLLHDRVVSPLSGSDIS